jgi:hypothetical protein
MKNQITGLYKAFLTRYTLYSDIFHTCLVLFHGVRSTNARKGMHERENNGILMTLVSLNIRTPIKSY